MTNPVVLDLLTDYQQRFQRIYPDYLPQNPNHIGDVFSAIHYSFAAGGKRLRPALIYALCDSLQIDRQQADYLAVAVECIHTYSLIHDDLPDMDDDDLRRGKPACHKQFNNGVAILAGDALNTYAFEVLATHAQTANIGLLQVKTLAKAAGIFGMVAGQDSDLWLSNSKQLDKIAFNEQHLMTLHQQKTGALIQAALLMTYQLAEHYTPEKADILAQAARLLGLLYQIQDDILDVTQASEVLGKPNGSDLAKHKKTYVSLLGLEQAMAKRDETAALLNAKLNAFFDDYATSAFAQLIDYIVVRDY